MQLGEGHVDFCQQCPLEASKGETQLSLFEDGLVQEKVGLSLVSPFVGAHGFSFSATSNGNMSVALPLEDTPYTVRLSVPVFLHILARGEGGGLSEKLRGSPRVQGFVIYWGWRDGCCFRSSHV